MWDRLGGSAVCRVPLPIDLRRQCMLKCMEVVVIRRACVMVEVVTPR